MNRRTAREKALQILFSIDLNNKQPTKAIEEFLQTNEEHQFLTTLVKGVIQNVYDIDKVISNHLENWTIDRIATIEKTILRIAIFEMEYVPDIPERVSVNEAVELAKKFGDKESGKFINGVLSKLISL